MANIEDRRAIALVDGEHYPDVTLDALAHVESCGRRIVALVFLGGTEKLSTPSRKYACIRTPLHPPLRRSASSPYSESTPRSRALQERRIDALGATPYSRDGVLGARSLLDYRGVPVFAGNAPEVDLRSAALATGADIVLDLSDEPVLSYEKRFSLISSALALGLDYEGSDFSFRAPRRPYVIDKPTIGVWGTGKRVGKTAVCSYSARRIVRAGTRTCILTMGRGGPRSPEVITAPEEVTDEYLRQRARAGLHAASDHFEDAMCAGVATIGCRRAGSGMAGEPFYSNVARGAALADQLDCDVVLCEGSGAAIPPVGTDSVLLVASALQPETDLLGYLGPYRLLQTDVLVVTMAEDFLVSSDKLRKLIDGVQSINPGVKVVKTVFRPRPLSDIEGRKVFLTSTASGEAVEIQARHLEKEYGASITGSSGSLADRVALQKDLEMARGADVIATELKAAGVDTVSTFAARCGIELVYLENVPMAVEGDLDTGIDRLLRLARERYEVRNEPAGDGRGGS